MENEIPIGFINFIGKKKIIADICLRNYSQKYNYANLRMMNNYLPYTSKNSRQNLLKNSFSIAKQDFGQKQPFLVVTNYSLMVPNYSLMVVNYSLMVANYSLMVANHSLMVANHSLLGSEP
jgi:hypothetical protein